MNPEKHTLGLLNKIPILVYHKIEHGWEFGVTCISPDSFRKHLLVLKARGYQSVTFSEVLAGSPIPRKPVIISFDDGFESVHRNAFPLMQELGFRGVVFVVSGFLGRTNRWDVNPGRQIFRHLNRAQLRELHRQGWEIGSHTVTHRPLPYLNRQHLERELQKSRQELSDLIGEEIHSIAYPFGMSNPRVRKAAREAGYQVGCGNLPWKESPLDTMALPRIPVYSGDGVSAIERKLVLNGQLSFERLRLKILGFPARFTPLYQILFRREIFLEK